MPALMQEIDKKLLLHKPEVWSSRTHLVAWYSFLFIGVLAIISYLEPNDLRAASNTVYWSTFLSIISFVALIVWLIFLLRFNVFKRYGNISGIGRLSTFLLYFAAISFFVLAPFTHSIVETIKANQKYGDAEIVNDVNSLNKSITWLEYDSIPHEWERDTLQVMDKTSAVDDNEDRLIAKRKAISPYNCIDTADFRQRFERRDSLEKLNDSVYIFFECHDYQYLKPYNLNSFQDSILYSKQKIFDLVVRNYKQPNVAQLKSEIEKLYNKYFCTANVDRYSSYYAHSDEVETVDYADAKKKITIPEKYKLSDIRESMDHILSKKHRYDNGSIFIYLRVFFYITFGLSLLIFVFRHSTTKTFFLSLLVMVLLTIISGLFIAFAKGYRDEDFTFFWYFFYFAIALVISLTTFSARKRNLVQGIAINIFTLSVSFVPILIVALYYSIVERNLSGLMWEVYKQSTAYQIKSTLFLCVEIGEIIMLLILIPTLIHKLYRKWYALPEQ